MKMKCPHCGEEITMICVESIQARAPVPKSEARFLDYQEWYVEDSGEKSLSKHVFGRPEDVEKYKHWLESWNNIKGSMDGMDYHWELDGERGLKVLTTGYEMFFSEPFPDIWFFFWLPDDNYFRQKFFEDCRLVVEDDGTFRTEVLNEEGEFVDGGGAHGSTSKETVEKYKKRLEGIVPDDPRKDTFHF